MRVLWLSAMFLIVTLAGCTDEAPDDGMDGSLDGEGDSMQGDEGDDTDAQPLPDLQEPVTQEWFFTSSNGLQNETPAEGTTSAGGGFSSFFTGGAPPSFTSDPVDEPTLILPESIDLDLYFTSSAPGSYNAGFSYAVWAGSTQSMPIVFVGQTPGPVVPDETHHLEISLDWGTRLPVLVEPGGSIQIIVAINVDGASDAGAVSLLVGGEETASKATITTQAMNIDPLANKADATSETYSGTLVTGNPASCEVADDVSHTYHDVIVGDNVSFLRAESSGTDASGSGDLDIDMFDGSNVLGGGHTASADEGILWAGPDFEELRGKTLTLRVGVCIAAEMDYDVVVTQG